MKHHPNAICAMIGTQFRSSAVAEASLRRTNGDSPDRFASGGDAAPHRDSSPARARAGARAAGVLEARTLFSEDRGDSEVSPASFEKNFRDANPHAVLFLDVDGVLNTVDPRKPPVHVEPELLRRLGDFVRTSGAHVVLSSSWRNDGALKRILFRALARDAGLPASRIVGQTPYLSWIERPREIQEWLMLHPSIRVWVAVDDMDLEAMAAQATPPSSRLLSGHFVKTEPTAGLTKQAVGRLLELLSTQQAQRAQSDVIEGIGPLLSPEQAPSSRPLCR